MNRNFFDIQLFARTVRLTSCADNYENSTANRIIYALAGNDYIYNDGSYMGIDNGNVTISGGTSVDSIVNYEADSVSIDGGADADEIKTLWSDHVTIKGGKGNDSIQLGAYHTYESWSAKNSVIEYASGDGKDTIRGFNSDDTLHITKGTYSVTTKDDDVIVKVGSGSITLRDAVGKLFAEDNFATSDNISAIVENNFSSLGEIEIQDFDILKQKNNLITYSEK